jgi:urea transport system permease protein
MSASRRIDTRRLELIGIALVAVLILVLLPLVLDIFRLNLVGKYLTYAFVAIGLVLCWGHTGILSLGQGLFFGLGGYCMAAFPQARGLERRQHQDPVDARHPRLHGLEPADGAALLLGPVQIAAARPDRRHRGADDSGLHSRRSAVQAAGGRRLLCHHHPGAGVGDDHPDRRPAGLYRRHQWHHRSAHAAGLGYPHRRREICSLFHLLRAAAGTMFVARFVLASKLGRILVATRDKEDRVRFSGYDVANYKIFVFCLASAMAGVGGAMFTLQVGFMSPSFVGIVPSIDMVIFCAVGGRNSIVGAVAGTLLVNWAKTMFSEAFPELWLFAMGGLFIAVVVAFPRGIAGVMTDQIIPKFPKLGFWKDSGRGEPSGPRRRRRLNRRA